MGRATSGRGFCEDERSERLETGFRDEATTADPRSDGGTAAAPSPGESPGPVAATELAWASRGPEALDGAQEALFQAADFGQQRQPDISALGVNGRELVFEIDLALDPIGMPPGQLGQATRTRGLESVHGEGK